MLALIPELDFSLTLESLLSPHILQPRIEIPHLLHHIIHLFLVRALDRTRLANDHVELELDAADLTATKEKAGSGPDIRRRETEPVLAGICSRECEFTIAAAVLADNAVVVVEGLVDGNVDALSGISRATSNRVERDSYHSRVVHI